VHFLIVGGAFFALAPRPPSNRDIHLSSAALEALTIVEERRAGKPLDDKGREAVRDRALEDEVLLREAARLGLDRDDPIVRQRLIQKVLFLAEDLSGASKPATPGELRAFYEATHDRWVSPPRVDFEHVFIAQGNTLNVDELKKRAQESTEHPPAVGDAFPMSRAVSASMDELKRDYGVAFAEAVFAQPIGELAGPVASKYGSHLVRVLRRSEARPATFEEARGELSIAYLVSRKRKATEDLLARAFDRYRADLDGAPIATLKPTGRTAADRPKLED
jgi:hypothetical protein